MSINDPPYHSMASSTASDVNVPYEESRSHTNFKVAKFNHTWTISNFSIIEERVGRCLMSAFFPLSGHEDNGIKWYLKLYPKGENKDNKDFVSIFLSVLDAKKSEIKANFTIGVINPKGERSIVKSSKIWTFDTPDSIGYPKFVKQDYLLNEANGLMQDNKLVLFCNVTVFTDISNRCEKVNEIQFTEMKYHPLENIEHLFETKKFSDVTLNACDTQFKAHKIVLASQSPVFAALLFEHNMEEKKKSCVDIIDVNDEVLKEMLSFLYTGKVKDIQKIATDLLAAAEKYALGRLKIVCEEALRTRLTIENAAETLILADLHRADQLKSQVISFIRFYATEVMNTAGFKLMFLSHPNLTAEAFCKLEKKKIGNSSEMSETDAPPSKLRRTH